MKKGYELLSIGRLVSYFILNTQSANPFKQSITDWMPLATDLKAKKVTEEVTQEKLEEIIKQHQQIFKKHA
jgi:hypothetical protein